ncbi:unnamed protein product [Blepharisma stoltei]|uniref:Uncharacterized protein n=1 Tax=Blepharisma stoltei TaxID=1481888 RepID=A0AAU9JR51_9CILI|nr:unnamed protein product [Blepharisma stoltei]
MGCLSSRSHSSIEATLVENEKFLGFCQLDAEVTDSIIRKFSFNRKINCSQLSKIAESLNIHIEDYDAHANITKMYNRLKNSDNEILMRDLLTIGILLSKGRNITKATLLFQIFDETLEEEIEITRIKGQVFRTISRNSIYILGALIDENNEDSTKRIQNYFKTLKRAEIFAIDNVVDFILDDKRKPTISEKGFVEGMCRFQSGKLLTASGWRKYLASFEEKLPLELQNSQL